MVSSQARATFMLRVLVLGTCAAKIVTATTTTADETTTTTSMYATTMYATLPTGTQTTTTTTTVLMIYTATSAMVTAGSTIIPLTDISGIEVGFMITLTSGSDSETKTVVAIQGSRRLSSDGRRLAAGSVQINSPLQNSYPAGTQVVATPGPTSASAGNDPVVWFGKQSKEFWLPVGKLTPILHERHLNVLASTFTGSPREQWIDHIVVTNADGFRLADIRIKKNIASFNRSEVPSNGFESIEVKLGMAQSPLQEMPTVPPTGSQNLHTRMNVWVQMKPLSKVFNWLPWHVDETHIGKARREAVIISSPDTRLLIISSPATEYSGDFSYLSVEYAHLDIHILDMQHKPSVRGVLPEIWGIQKMSNRTVELTCPPWEKKAPLEEHHHVDVDAEWNQYFSV